MSLIINIDTSTEAAHVSIAQNGIMLESAANDLQNNHAAFLQPAIKQLLQKHSVAIKSIDAVAVTAGPGSYTGLRVGMASAKGLCYALNKPLIKLNTLEVMAASAIYQLGKEAIQPATFLCPMLDARRQEVYAAVYDINFTIIIQPAAMVLDEHSFSNELAGNQVIFFGNGSGKWKTINSSAAAVFADISIKPEAMNTLSYNSYLKNNFASVAYSEPFYLKEFYTVTRQL